MNDVAASLKTLEAEVEAVVDALQLQEPDQLVAACTRLKESTEQIARLASEPLDGAEADCLRRIRAATAALQEQLQRRLVGVEQALRAVLPQASGDDATYSHALRPDEPRHANAARIYRAKG